MDTLHADWEAVGLVPVYEVSTTVVQGPYLDNDRHPFSFTRACFRYMWPWGHAAVGYVLFTVLSIGYRRRPLTGTEAVVVAAGTQIPDLIDKPLSWTFDILPTGRTLGHSLLVWAVVATLVLAVAHRFGRERIAVLVLGGYFVGAITDVPPAALSDFSQATFLAWPVLPSPVYEAEPSVLYHLGQFGTDELVEVPLVVLALISVQFVLSKLLRGGSRRASKFR